MSRNTIDFGIDLGTTNSSIAMLRGTDTEIIKNNENFEITPYMITRRLFDLRRVASDGGFIPNRSGVEVDAIAPRFSVNGLKDQHVAAHRLAGAQPIPELRRSGRSPNTFADMLKWQRY